jgi:hypothetical protein
VGVQRSPSTEVTPTEVGRMYIDVGRLLHDSIVYRDVGTCGEEIANNLRLVWGV